MVELELGLPSDIDAIRAIEAKPAYVGLVGCWTHDRHEEEMATTSSRYFVLRTASGVAGFALVQGLGNPDCRAHLKRIAVREPGSGDGSRLLRGVIDWLYTNSDTNRLDLDVFLGNERARRAYEKAGFQVEGVLRDYHRDTNGSFSSMWLMSILRRDWAADVPGRS